MTDVFRYDPVSIRWEWVRVGAGALTVTVLAAAASDSRVVVLICLGVLVVIGFYAADLFLRQFTELRLSDEGIELVSTIPRLSKRPLRAQRIAWRELSEMALRFYPTRRERDAGWFELVLKAGAATMKIQSSLTGFGELVLDVARRARDQDVPLSAATEHNLGYFTRVPKADRPL